MPWQRVVGHVSNSRIIVESKSGNRYPVATGFDHIGEGVYSLLHNIDATAHKRPEGEEREIWAWVNFDGGDPVAEYTSSGSPQGGPPEKPPWDLHQE